MVNWYILGCGIIVIVVGFYFFTESYSFVDVDNHFNTGGLALFLGGMVGIILGFIVVYRGLTDDS